MHRHRSPRYPYIGLAKALALAAELPRAEMPVEGVAKAWGREGGSSRVAQAIAALRQYGLIHVARRGKSSHLELTLLGDRLRKARRPRDLCDAALNPMAFEFVWNKMQSGATSREALIQLLTSDYEYGPPFSPRAAEEVLRIFVANAELAKLEVGDELAKAVSTMHGPVVQEEILAQGKIRIQYRGSPDRKDFEEARAHFAAKAKAGR